MSLTNEIKRTNRSLQIMETDGVNQVIADFVRLFCKDMLDTESPAFTRMISHYITELKGEYQTRLSNNARDQKFKQQKINFNHQKEKEDGTQS